MSDKARIKKLTKELTHFKFNHNIIQENSFETFTEICRGLYRVWKIFSVRLFAKIVLYGLAAGWQAIQKYLRFYFKPRLGNFKKLKGNYNLCKQWLVLQAKTAH